MGVCEDTIEVYEDMMEECEDTIEVGRDKKSHMNILYDFILIFHPPTSFLVPLILGPLQVKFFIFLHVLLCYFFCLK